MDDLVSPDGALAARWYVWRRSEDRFDDDVYWRVDILNPLTGAVLLTRSYSRSRSLVSGHESGAEVRSCAFSPDSRRLEIRLSDGSAEEVDLSALDLHPKCDATMHYRLDWTPLPPSGCRIRIVDATYGHPHRELEIPPEPGKVRIRRVGFSDHPGVVVAVRADGTMETRPYGRRAWPGELHPLLLDPLGWIRGSALSAPLGLQGDPGETRGSLAFWDAVSGRQIALQLRGPVDDFAFDAPFRIRVGGESLSILDFLLPYGDVQFSPDRSRVLRWLTTIEDVPDPRRRWSLVEIYDAVDGRRLQRMLFTAPFEKRKDETVTVSDVLALPADPLRALPRPLAAVRFEATGLRGTLDDGSEIEL